MQGVPAAVGTRFDRVDTAAPSFLDVKLLFEKIPSTVDNKIGLKCYYRLRKNNFSLLSFNVLTNG